MDVINSRIFSSGNVALFHWEAKDRCPIISVSPSIQNILGYSVVELTSRKRFYADLIHPDDQETVYQQISKSLQANVNEFDRFTYRLISKDSAIVWVEDHTVVVRDDKGYPTGYIGYIIDVTDRHVAEQESIASKERIEAITDLMSDWAWEVDQNGVYTYCSDRVEKFLGYRADEIIGNTPFDLMPEDEASKVANTFTEIVKNKAPIHNLENWNLSKEGKPVCLRTNGIPLLSETGELLGYRGVDTDITEQKNNEQLLRRAHNAAVEALRIKNQFLGNISHELRTPLNGIYGALQLLQESSLTDEQGKYVNIATDSSRQLLELVNNLLSYSSIEAGRISIKKKPTIIRDLVYAHHQTTSLLIKNAAVRFELNIDDQIPDEIITDPIWLNQVLSNLTNNAIKFTPRGTISINLTLPDNDNQLLFEVTDTGIGIKQDHCDKIFEPFYQVDSGTTRKFDGAGLGLAITKDVVQHLGGQLGIESQFKKGTRVWFTLPTFQTE